MAFTTQETTDIESAMADFMTKRRPPEEIRDRLDLAWRIKGQSVVIYSIRPSGPRQSWRHPEPE